VEAQYQGRTTRHDTETTEHGRDGIIYKNEYGTDGCRTVQYCSVVLIHHIARANGTERVAAAVAAVDSSNNNSWSLRTRQYCSVQFLTTCTVEAIIIIINSPFFGFDWVRCVQRMNLTESAKNRRRRKKKKVEAFASA